MRRFFLLIGLLLIPTAVSAAALSPWVDHVISRAENAKSFALGLPVGSCEDVAVMQEIENNLSLVRSSVNASVDLAQEAQFTKERTVCFQSDRRLLEDELKKILDALNGTAASCNAQAATALREDYAFLADAYRSFLRGSADPGFKDDTLWYTYPFENQTLWDNGSEKVYDENSTEPLCPYTTDYGPHAIAYIPASGAVGVGSPSFDIKSYGCDKETINALPLGIPIEMSDFTDFLDHTDSLASDLYTLISQTLFNINSTIAILTSKTPPTPPTGAASPPPHAVASGCLRPPSPELGGGGDPAAVDQILDSYPDYFDEKNLRIDPATGQPTFNPPQDLLLPVGMLFRPTTDFFLSMPNALILSRAFIAKQNDAGFDRPLPNWATGTNYDDMFQVVSRMVDSPDMLRFISSNIQGESGFYDAVGRDSYERNGEAAKPLEKAVQALSDITENYFPKKYVPQVTYLLLRSCVDAHCQKTLDTVARRILNPFCHPYVSGKYTDQKLADKCFCRNGFENENFCMGQSNMGSQPDAELQCGEPTSSSSSAGP